jgi:phage shock protein PspC (stress-responsive transcriptional regulator)
MLLGVLGGALGLLLWLTIRVPANRLAGVSAGLAEQRGYAAALIAVLLFVVMLGLLVTRVVSQP